MTLGRTITLKDLTGGGKAAMAEALAVLESAPDAAQTISLLDAAYTAPRGRVIGVRSEEHTSELQSLMRISYAVFCLKKNNNGHTVAIIVCNTPRPTTQTT